MTVILEIDSLGRRIQNAWIWKNLSLRIHGGDRLGVVGPSGTGKTLLLRTIASLDSFEEGGIIFLGRRLENWFIPEYRKRVVYLHQRPLLQEGTVEYNLRAVFGFKVHRHRLYDRDRALALFQALGRSRNFLDREVQSLSGGEIQMAAFVRALQLEPEVLLLDEPNASMDEESSKRLEELLLNWQSENNGRALVITTHNREQIRRLCTNILNLGSEIYVS